MDAKTAAIIVLGLAIVTVGGIAIYRVTADDKPVPAPAPQSTSLGDTIGNLFDAFVKF